MLLLSPREAPLSFSLGTRACRSLLQVIISPLTVAWSLRIFSPLQAFHLSIKATGRTLTIRPAIARDNMARAE